MTAATWSIALSHAGGYAIRAEKALHKVSTKVKRVTILCSYRETVARRIDTHCVGPSVAWPTVQA
jgi:hypothetical protein